MTLNLKHRSLGYQNFNMTYVVIGGSPWRQSAGLIPLLLLLLKYIYHYYFSIMCTAQKMRFSIKDFFSKCDRICRKLRIWSHLLETSLMENFIFWTVVGLWASLLNQTQYACQASKNLDKVSYHPGQLLLFELQVTFITNPGLVLINFGKFYKLGEMNNKSRHISQFTAQDGKQD